MESCHHERLHWAWQVPILPAFTQFMPIEISHPPEYGLRLTPEGALIWDGGKNLPDPFAKTLKQAMGNGVGEVLLKLAGKLGEWELPDSLKFWRDFAKKYLIALCHIPRLREDGWQGGPAALDWAEIIAAAPLQPGMENLSPAVLNGLWGELNDAMGKRVKEAGDIAEVLVDIHPVWRLVGRVTLHLAENKRSPEYPFAFLATYSHRVDAASQLQFLPLAQALKESAARQDRSQLLTLLEPLKAGAQRSDLLNELIESKQIFQPLAWTPTEAFRLLKDLPALEDAGLIVRVPDWWQGKRGARPTVTVTLDTGKKTSGVGANAILGFDVAVALGDHELTAAELEKLMESDAPLVSLKGQWVEIDRNKLAQTLALWRKAHAANANGIPFHLGLRMLSGFALGNQPMGGLEDLELTEGGWTSIAAGNRLKELLEKLRDPGALLRQGKSPIIPGLKATLRHYQQTGVEWLHFMGRLGMGACLADDMGLGKTLQVISLLLLRRKEMGVDLFPSLLVVPASLLGNWKRELEKFAPSLPYLIAHRSALTVSEAYEVADGKHRAFRKGAVIITTYTTLAKLEGMLKLQFDVAVLDEAQAIKNAGTTQARTVKKIHARQRIALTGTPIENRIDDLWSLFDFLNPGLLGGPTEFSAAAKRLSGSPQGFAPMKRLLRPYLLRRMKTDPTVAPDLPAKTEVTAFCQLNKRQASLYQRAVTALKKELAQAEDQIQRQGVVLGALMKLKQICNHPSLWSGDKTFDVADSGKYDRLAEIARDIADRQDKVLIFSQFREMTGPLAEFLGGVFGRPGLVLHGGTPVGKRAELVEQFQAPGGPPFFVISLKAGGAGLNLTAASHVVHFDRWWNPAVEDQATDRAFRIGQKKAVLVHKFVCQGTLEERIDDMIQDKKAVANEILGEDAAAAKSLTNMSDEELLNFVRLDVGSL